MKRLLAGGAILLALMLPPQAQAITVTYTSFIGASTTTCTQDGYISPSTNTANEGDVLTINFKNEKPLNLQVRGIPGGNFVVAGNTTVSKSFTTTETINYSIWLSDGSCQKAAAVINVTPAPEPAPTPTPTPTPAPSSSPAPSSNSPAPSASSETTPSPTTGSSTTNEADSPDLKEANFASREVKDYLWWLLSLALLLLILALALKRRRNRNR